jgi:polysaccharide deacetylase family protein (PEP-CTERM system associated)
MRMVNALTVDVEDYFQVQALAGRVRRDDWEHWPSRVERNTNRLLDLLAEAGTSGTFFTLGWVAERFPAVVRRIVAEGHELASHGWAHLRVFEQTPAEFRADVRRTKAVLEDAGGVAVRGYRAATFSIRHDTSWAFEVLDEEGYAYSSSVYPVRHDLYGMPDAPRMPFRPHPGLAVTELPMSVTRLAGRDVPCSGGGFFRLLPYPVFRGLVRRVNRERRPCMFYLHPWEIDPGQPRVAGLPARSRLRHYLNLSRTEGRLRRLLADFAWDRVDRVFLPQV